jgi:hypothetical protein
MPGSENAPERLGRLCPYSVFNSLSVIGRCEMNVNILATKIGALKMGH